MGILQEVKSRVQTEGVRIDPLALNASRNILDIFDQLSIDDSEIDLLKIPVVSAYVKGMQALPHDKGIDFDALPEQVHYAMARELASRHAVAGKKP